MDENTSAIDFFKEQCINKNTQRATCNWIRKYQTWAASNSVEEDMEKMDPVLLNKTLEIYFSEIKKADEFKKVILSELQAIKTRQV